MFIPDYRKPVRLEPSFYVMVAMMVAALLALIVGMLTTGPCVAVEPDAPRVIQLRATGRIAKQLSTPDGRLADYDAKTRQYWVQDFSVRRPLTQDEVRACAPVPEPVRKGDDKPVHWKWPQPHGEDAATWEDDSNTWIEKWAKHRHDPQQYREPGPPLFPQSWNDVDGEYDQVQYETILEVHRFYADRMNDLETRLEKLERKANPPDDDWPVVN